jgi:hypothetical protein
MSTRTILPKVVNKSDDLDGSTVTFSLPDSFISGTLEVWINGLRLTPSVDFTEADREFTLVAEDAPEFGEHMVAKYYPAEAARDLGQDGYLSAPRQVADQYGTPRIIYD